ncbi:TPA: HAD family hydrolase [Methanosarcinaceae archaeon]|nr:HAD family hydrolase [Methanosarcinaceae archaeon]
MSKNQTSFLKAVLFDMDNTLFDFVAAKLIACREILAYLEKGSESKGEEAKAGAEEELFRYFLRGVHGFEDYENIRDYLQERSLFTPPAYSKCCEIYEKEKLENLELYPGVRATFDELEKLDLKLAVITDADSSHARARLGKVGLLDSFELMVAADMTGRKKPDPEPFLFALRNLDVKPGETLVVGDNLLRDIAPARKLGLHTAYAAYGDWKDWRKPGKTTQPFDFRLNTFPDLLQCICSLKEQN